MNWIVTVGTGVLTIFASYKIYNYGKEKFYKYIMEKVREELDDRMKNEEEMFRPFHKNSSAILNISQGGKTHSVYLPYDRRKSTSMLRKKVYLLKGNEKIDISQKPGIPYVVSASMLGGEFIIIEDPEGNIIKQYSKDEIPNYF
jgi:hypothetical protein